MKRTPISFVLLFLVFALHAQLDPIHQGSLSGNCEKVFIHSGTGIPIFKTTTTYEAMHPQTYATMWSIKRQSGSTITEATSDETVSDYFEMPYSNIIYVGNSFVDVLKGEVLVDGQKDEINRLKSYHIIPAKDLLLVKVAAKGVYRLYGFDPIKGVLRWKSDIDDLAAVSLTGMMENDPYTESTSGLKPFVEAGGNIVYSHQKNMMLIDQATGKVKWTQPLEPGIVLFSKSGKLLAVAERRSGLGSVMDMSGGSKFGKKLVVVDAATGENAWKKEIKLDGNIKFMQPYKDGFIVAHDEGLNIYDFNSPKGESQWKKDFAAKEISDVTEDGTNIMVYYKDRRMLMNPETGEEVWKKAEKLEEEVPVFTGGQKNMVNDVEIKNSGTQITLNHTKLKKYTFLYAYNYAVDPKAGTLLGVHDGSLTYVDLKTLKKDTKVFSFNDWVTGVEPVPQGYFINSKNDFALVNMVNGKVNIIKEKKYPIPGAFGRGLLRVATDMAAVGVYTASAYGATKSVFVGTEEDIERYVGRMNLAVDAGNTAHGLQKRSTLVRLDKDYAFFFSKNDNDALVLFQVRKSDGTEYEQYKFDDKTPVYELDFATGNLYYMNGKALKVFKLKA